MRFDLTLTFYSGIQAFWCLQLRWVIFPSRAKRVCATEQPVPTHIYLELGQNYPPKFESAGEIFQGLELTR
jgi:hypothetical protein